MQKVCFFFLLLTFPLLTIKVILCNVWSQPIVWGNFRKIQWQTLFRIMQYGQLVSSLTWDCNKIISKPHHYNVRQKETASCFDKIYYSPGPRCSHIGQPCWQSWWPQTGEKGGPVTCHSVQRRLSSPGSWRPLKGHSVLVFTLSFYGCHGKSGNYNDKDVRTYLHNHEGRLGKLLCYGSEPVNIGIIKGNLTPGRVNLPRAPRDPSSKGPFFFF